MFFYISFLRPPPTQATPVGTIPITIQISNDLRTEQFGAPQDIFYSWAPYSQSLPPATSSPPAFTLKPTTPAKLTTYRNSSAYKEIPVPQPPGVGEGQRWQLILSSSLQPGYAIDMREPSIGSTVLPVISMPILFSMRGLKGSIKKQERIERIYRISDLVGEPTAPAGIRELKITEQTSFDLDKKIWDSGIGLSSWLVDFQQLDQSQRNHPLDILWAALFSKEHLRLVELGAGTGIVSIVVASLRAQFNTSEHQNDEVIATDLASALPLLNHNTASNLSLFTYNVPKSDVLDWDDDELPQSVRSLGSLDVILMSDVTYNTSSFPALLRTVSKLSKMGEKSPVILLGYKERDGSEREMWTMMEEMGVRLEKVGERRGTAEPAVEIWFGRVSGPSLAIA